MNPKARGKSVFTACPVCFFAANQKILFRALAFFVVFDASALGNTGIAVRFVVAAADGVVLHGANAVCFGGFCAFVGFACKTEEANARCAQREKNVFHWKRTF